MTAVPTPAETVTLVTQTRVLPGKDGEFAAWQQQIGDAAAAFPDFIDQTVREPSPPAQLDWAIIQRFRSMEAAQAWLRSPERQQLLATIEPLLVGQDDVHLFAGGSAQPLAAAASAVISTRVAPGKEGAFRAWQTRIVAAEASFSGFQGVRLEPPIPGVQDDWATVVRFDSNDHLQAWLTSPRRQRLQDEATELGVESHVRTVRGGFEGWFELGLPPGTAPPPAWKQNMVVLLVLYPVVFLLGQWLQKPFLLDRGVPVWLALFLTNAVGVTLMGSLLMSPVDRALRWWLTPPPEAPAWTNAAGAALILALYGASLAIFSQFP
jgi:antibiotic biosynthesis monooxygenase (ABM) superfamily enzyme